MKLFNWLKTTPEDLYKKKQQEEFLEALRCSSITVTKEGRMTRHGMSEYGALKLLASGEEPTHWDMVMTEQGNLITWKQWKENK